MTEALIFELSAPGRKGVSLPEADLPTPMKDPSSFLSANFLRKDAPELPEVSEIDAIRHFTRLSRMNHGVDVGFYPLGSCTMKYNPKVNEEVAAMPGFSAVHPYEPAKLTQGALELMYRLEKSLCEITGMSRFTLQPAAGAHGEYTGLLIIKAYHANRNEAATRRKIVVPDSAHGTNPASAAVCGFDIVKVESNERGGVDVEALRKLMGPDIAGLMLTNPNTLGLFDENIAEIADIIHQAGGLLYYDGANTNAIMGISRPGDMGFDVVHLNLHKTFATPHGGGGPGAGPVGVKEHLVPFLPYPLVGKDAQDNYCFEEPNPLSIGKVKAFYGNFGVLVKAFAYILTQGHELKEVSELAVLNANYVLARLKPYFDLPYDRICMHEFVLSGKRQKKNYGVSTLDMAKRLLDFGYHAPTVYFPLIVDEAMMIEPTETESIETLDEFSEALIRIAKEAETNPEGLHAAPTTTPVSRLDEVGAARNPVLKWTAAK